MNACQILIIDKLIIKAAEIYGIEPAQINSRSQLKKTCIARGIVWFTAHKELSLSYRKIGSTFLRGHKTIHSSVRAVSGEITVNPEIKMHCGQLSKVINETLQTAVCRA